MYINGPYNRFLYNNYLCTRVQSAHSTFYLSIHGPTLLLGRDTEDSTDEDAVAHNLQPGVREPGSLGYIIVNQCVFDIFKEIEKETTHTHVNTCRCKKKSCEGVPCI